tara:strand:- start:5812 stop:6375 length:564 start_codon:yes stop_codon:yes gene_type:complete
MGYKIILLFLIIILSILMKGQLSNDKKDVVKAIAVFNNKNCKMSGYVEFIEDINKGVVNLNLKLKGLTPGKHGFHIHEAGNLLDGCGSCKSHFNPYNTNHGGPNSKVRHVGDLGNVVANSKGEANYQMSDKMIKLRGTKCNIIGRSLVIHDKEDDLGLGGNAESLKTGNAGSRIGCAVIGYATAHYH